MKLIEQLFVTYQEYESLHIVRPDLLIVDEYYRKCLKEEICEFGAPDFLKNITITVVPRYGKTEVRFYKRLKMIRLEE